MTTALIIGAGPAGLMAADVLSTQGVAVTVADQMPSPARKFLMAGKSGLNLTKAEKPQDFAAKYPDSSDSFAQGIADFGPEAVTGWAQDLGQDTFVGSTGRVFPTAMKASPLLRAWLAKLSAQGVTLQRRWRWTGFDGAASAFATPDGIQHVTADVTVLATGGGSWRRLGSDGAWAAQFADEVTPFAPSNVGVLVDWSPYMAAHFGTPLKGCKVQAGGCVSRGECVISSRGLEGGGIYSMSAPLRQGAALLIDVKPDLTLAEVRARLSRPRGKASMAQHLRKSLRIEGAKAALLNEYARPFGDDLASKIKALPVAYAGLRPIDEAISTAGGLTWDALDGWMLRRRPGVFAAGEMLDWDAPTGGYLITGCLASGKAAAEAALAWWAREGA